MMRQRIRAIVHNPFVAVVPLVMILWGGWQQYTYAGRSLSRAETTNLLSNGDLERFDAHGLPTGWRLNNGGDLSFRFAKLKGYVSGSGFGITVTDYKRGDLTLTTPAAKVAPGQKYLFKGYYAADAPFALLARYHYRDGATQLQFLRDYPANKGVWSTVSDAIDTTSLSIDSVEYVYSMHANGGLQIDDTYMEARSDVVVDSTATGASLLPNGAIAAQDGVNPDGWSTYRHGDGVAEFQYAHDDHGAYLQVQQHGTGPNEAKWQYDPLPVQPHGYYRFGATYRSDVGADLVAESRDVEGRPVFQTLMALPPASQWTHIWTDYEAPAGAAMASLSLQLHNEGTLASRDYVLFDRTKAGMRTWSRPLVSVTFDDGWESSFQNGLPILEKYGLKATFYVNPMSIETTHFMRARQLAALVQNGHEVAAHGYEHDDLTAISAAALDYQLGHSRDYLTQAGYPTADVAAPYGRIDSQVGWYARKYFQTLRGTETGINTRQNFDPYNLLVIYADNITSEQTIREALDQARAQKGWLIFVYHGVDTRELATGGLKVENPTLTPDAVARQFAIIHESGLTVLPVRAAYDEVKGQ